MLNRVILMGRITQDLEVRQTPNGIAVLTFNLAVDRSYQSQNGERQTDFITCVAWRQQAEFISRYFSKGRMIAIEGNLRTRTYDDKNGTRHYVTEVFVDSVSFTGEPKAQNSGTYANAYGNGGYQNQTSNSNYQRQPQAQNSNYGMPNNGVAPSNDALSIGNLADFEEVLSDDGVPF